jgi:hypothetical protein
VNEAPAPLPIRICCEKCGVLHVDVGECATRPHSTHTCQNCGLTWKPSLQPTVGVAFLPGCRSEGPHVPGGTSTIEVDAHVIAAATPRATVANQYSAMGGHDVPPPSGATEATIPAPPDEPCKCGERMLKSWWEAISDAGDEGTDSMRHTRTSCLTATEELKRLGVSRDDGAAADEPVEKERVGRPSRAPSVPQSLLLDRIRVLADGVAAIRKQFENGTEAERILATTCEELHGLAARMGHLVLIVNEPTRIEVEQRIVEACRMLVYRKAAPNTASALQEVVAIACRLEGAIDGDLAGPRVEP